MYAIIEAHKKSSSDPFERSDIEKQIKPYLPSISVETISNRLQVLKKQRYLRYYFRLDLRNRKRDYWFPTKKAMDAYERTHRPETLFLPFMHCFPYYHKEVA